MSKISTYEVAPVPKLSDKLIGTSVGGEIEDVTYNFTLQELLEVFLPVIPANNLQGILDYGNTATQDINLFGTITTTNLDVTDTANLFITYLNEETHLVGSLFDSADSVGTAGQVLTSTGDGVEWFTLPPIFTPTLQQVLEEGNTADIDIILDANLEALDVSADTATVGVNLTLGGTITDNNSAVGSAGQVLESTVTGVQWTSLPVYSATSPLLFNSGTGVFSIQPANSTQGGYLTANDWVTFDGKQDAGAYITALTGEATATGPGSVPITLNNASVIAKVLTGLNVTGGSISASDSILTAFGKVQSQINGLMGGVQYQGVWDAATNTPTLTSSVGTQGHYYIVNVAGNTDLNGITDWKVGDWAIFSGGTWQKVDNTESVTSVNGQTGAVSLTTDNIPEGATNLYYLDSRARGALSFVAGSGAYNSLTGVITIPTNNNQILNGANYITLASLSANSPLTYNNLTGAFGIPQATALVDGYLSATDWSTFNNKQNYLGGTGLVKSTAGTITYITDNSGNWNTAYNRSIVSAAVTGTTTKTLTLNEQDGNTIQASWTDLDTGLTSVGVSMPSAFSVANSPLTSNGTIAVTGAGTTLEYIDGTGALRTFPGLTGYVPYTGATQNVALGEFGISAGYFQADLTPTGALQVGRMQWNSTDGTMDLRLLGNNVTLQIGQENVTRVVNKSGIDLLEANYQVVRIRKVAEGGAQGQRLAVVLAQGNNENNSTEVIGLVTETINVNQEGFVTSFGEVKEINTTGSLQGETWVDGDILYLSSTVAGQLTNIRPVAPNHSVIVGYVVYAHANNGKIYMAIDTGYELGELHNVYAPSPTANQSIYWDTTNSRYQLNTIGGILGYTPANDALVVHLAGTETITGLKTFSSVVNLGINGFILPGAPGVNPLQMYSTNFTSNFLFSSNSFGTNVNNDLFYSKDSNNKSVLSFNNTAERTYTFPDVSGTIALTSNLLGYVPYTGATSDVNLGAYGLTLGNNLFINGDNSTQGGYLGFKQFATTQVGLSGYTSFSALNSNILYLSYNTGVGTSKYVQFDNTNITNNSGITLSFPNASGTLALTSNLTGYLTAVTASSPLFSSGGTTPNITIQQASGSQNGYLSSTDWTTFNNKQAAGNYITSLTGEATATGPGAAAVTLNNASVTAKVLTGINITGGTVQATDTMLTAFGKLQNQINGLIGSTIYQGTWNASTNTPALASGVGVRGYYYIVSVAGNTNLDGITDWFVGDWAIFDGTAWQQVDNTDAVVSVNGQTGAVSLTTDNIPEGATNLYFTNARSRASLSFAAGSGAYNSTTGVITIPTNTNQLTNGASFITLASLSGTAPIVYSNTTGAISITQAGTASNGYLSSTDWNTFNNKQSTITNPVTGTGTTNYIPKFTGVGTIGNSNISDAANTATLIDKNGSSITAPILKIVPTTTTNASILNIDNAGAGSFFVGRQNSAGNSDLIGTVGAYDSVIGHTGTQNFNIVTSGLVRIKVDGTTGLSTFTSTSGNGITIVTNDVATIKMKSSTGGTKSWGFATTNLLANDFGIYQSTLGGGDPITAGSPLLYFNGGVLATFNLDNVIVTSNYRPYFIAATTTTGEEAGIKIQQTGLSNWYFGVSQGTGEAKDLAVRDVQNSRILQSWNFANQSSTFQGFLQVNNAAYDANYALNVSGKAFIAATPSSGTILSVRDSSATGSNTTFGGITLNSQPGADFTIGKVTTNAIGSFEIRSTGSNTLFAMTSTGILKLPAYGGGTVTGTPTYRLAVDASGNVIEVTDGGGTVTGTGTANYLSKWSGTSSITDSIAYDDGTKLILNGTTDPNIGDASTVVKLVINGDQHFSRQSAKIYFGDVSAVNPLSIGEGFQADSGLDKDFMSIYHRNKLVILGDPGPGSYYPTRVGIGATIPGYTLDIRNDNASFNRISTFWSGTYISGWKFSDLNGGITYDAGIDTLDLFANYPTNGIVTISTKGVTRVSVVGSGNLIVGDNQVDAGVDYKIQAKGSILIKGDVNSNYYFYTNVYASSTTTVRAQFGGNWQSPNTWGIGTKGATDSTVYIGNTSAGVIDPAGTFRLSVFGGVSATGVSFFNSRVNIGGATDDADIALNVNAPSGTGKYIMFGRNSESTAVYALSDTGVISATELSIPRSGGTTQIYNTGSGHTVITNSTANKDINYQVSGTGGHYFLGNATFSNNLTVTTRIYNYDFNTGGSGTGFVFGQGAVPVFTTAPSTGAATFSGNITIAKTTPGLILNGLGSGNSGAYINFQGWAAANRNWQIGVANIGNAGLTFTPSTADGGITFTTPVIEFFNNGRINAAGVTLSSSLIFDSALNGYIFNYARVAGGNAGCLIYNNGTGANMFFGELAANIYGFANGGTVPARAAGASILSWNIASTSVGVNIDNPNYTFDVRNGTTASVTLANFQAAYDALNEYGVIRIGQGSYAAYFGSMLQTYDVAYMGMSSAPSNGNGIYYSTANRAGINVIQPNYSLDVNGNFGVNYIAAFSSSANQSADVRLNVSIPAGSTFNSGGIWSGITSSSLISWGGSSTINAGAINAGILGVNRHSFTTTGTITVSQAGGGIRAVAAMQVLQQTGGLINGTISHGASLIIQGIYPTTAANITYTNYYGLLINNLTEWGGVTLGTRYAIYQAGSLDNNYFAGPTTFNAAVTFNGGFNVSGPTYSTYTKQVQTINGGLQTCRFIEDTLGTYVLVGRFAANAKDSILGTWVTVRGMSTSLSQSEATVFSADWGDVMPTEVRIMGATDFANWRDTRTVDFVYRVPTGRTWKTFFNGGNTDGNYLTSEVPRYGFTCAGTYDGFGRWNNPSNTQIGMSDAAYNNASTLYTTPWEVPLQVINWNTAGDAKLTAIHTGIYSGQDANETTGFGSDDGSTGFFDSFPSLASNMNGGNTFSSSVWVLIKLN